MLRRTKILATLGPATDKPGVLEAMVRAGVDVVRLNFSHGDAADHRRRMSMVRSAAAAVGKDIGVLSNSKGINRQGGGLTAKALTDKDLADIAVAAELGVDYLAISFPRDAADVEEARRLVRAAGSQARIVAKIERAEAVTNLEEIVRVSDAVMIARGDLAVEIGDAELPGVQKHIIQVARDLNTVVITATQMMESMVVNPVPTRAEVLDVANAVMDGTDAVMLSAETASGKHPVKVVEAMARVCMGAEKERMTQR